jgi:hypothetical protein
VLSPWGLTCATCSTEIPFFMATMSSILRSFFRATSQTDQHAGHSDHSNQLYLEIVIFSQEISIEKIGQKQVQQWNIYNVLKGNE